VKVQVLEVFWELQKSSEILRGVVSGGLDGGNAGSFLPTRGFKRQRPGSGRTVFSMVKKFFWPHHHRGNDEGWSREINNNIYIDIITYNNLKGGGRPVSPRQWTHFGEGFFPL